MNNNQYRDGLFLRNQDKNGNKIIYSQLKNFEQHDTQSRCISVKYVIDGTENYFFNRHSYNVHKGQYLLINAGQQYHGYFNGTEDVKGICFYLDNLAINDVFRNLSLKNDRLMEDYSGQASTRFFDLYEDVYSSHENSLGKYLSSISDTVGNGQHFILQDGNEIYYSMISKLLKTQGVVQEKISLIKAERYTTRKELYRRVNLGKQIMDDCYRQGIEIENIAEQATLSQFHFFRIFKQVFNISPYQYLIQLRLKNALAQLEQGKHSVSDIAFSNGFSDIYSFSKCFKKAYHYSPTKYILINKAGNEKD